MPHIAAIHAYFTHLHDFFQLNGSWSASLIFGTLLLRTVVALPASVTFEKTRIRLVLTRAVISESEKALKQEIAKVAGANSWSEREQTYRFNNAMSQLKRSIYQKNKCHPFKPFLCQLVQFPLWISVSFALRSLCASQFNGCVCVRSHYFLITLTYKKAALRVCVVSFSCARFTADSCLTDAVLFWTPNLIQPDPTGVLPTLCVLAQLLNSEVHYLNSPTATSLTWHTQTRRVLWAAVIVVLFSQIGGVMPAALPLFWLTSTVHQIGLNSLLMMPRVRRAFRVPNSPFERVAPFAHLYAVAWQRYAVLQWLQRMRKREKTNLIDKK